MTAQPPSGGCVLKPCVGVGLVLGAAQPPSGGCVLKPQGLDSGRNHMKPAAFRRLCVETSPNLNTARIMAASRLQAAVC